MNCRAFRSQLEELSMDSVVCDKAESHAAACPACGDFYRQHSTLKQLIQSIEHTPAPPDFDDKLNARLDAARHARPTPRFLYLDFIPGTASIAFASVFALAVCAAVLVKEIQFGSDAQPTQSIAARTNFLESAPPAAILNNDVPASKRAVYTHLASAAPKSLVRASLNKPVDAKSMPGFDEPRREARAPEKGSEIVEAAAPKTKSVVFSSSVAPLITRPAAAISIGTNRPSASAEPAPPKDRLTDSFLSSGVETKTLTSQLADNYGARGGLLVVSVQPQSAAFRAGLRSGDVIKAVNNQTLSGSHQPQNLKDTTALSLTVLRNNQKISITLPVAQPAHQ